MDCKTQIVSLLNRIRGKDITHVIITKSGNQIECYDSIDLYDDENKIIIAKAKIKNRDRLITINDDNIDYMLEDFTENTWNEIMKYALLEPAQQIEDNVSYR